MQLTPDELVAEFQDAVVELYFARKRIVVLESENAALRAQLAQAHAGAGTGPGSPAGGSPAGSAAGPQVPDGAGDA